MNKKYEYTVASRHTLGDMVTPVGIYLNIRDQYPQSVLLESSDYHDKDTSRSFIAMNPIASFCVEHGMVVCRFPDGRTEKTLLDETHPLHEEMQKFLDNFKINGDEKGWFGLYGYTSFNAVRYLEEIPVKDQVNPDCDAPDLLYILYKDLVIVDHLSNSLTLATLVATGEKDGLAGLEKAVFSHHYHQFYFRPVGECYSTLTDAEHKANISRGIRHCQRGDVFQIVLSRRFVQQFEGDDFQLYRSLRSINPSPYLFYFDFGGFRIFGASPETHCRISVSGRAYIDPIAGTTKRVGVAQKDREAAEFLKNDPKENAEHVMLVDLARNDLSRNCRDVKVEFYKDMQYYSHVIHLVSRVSGQIKEGQSRLKTFLDTFPAGTLSGAPKVRAMQLISEYEPHNRGSYGGCIGFIGFDGSLNQAIAIRTFVSRAGELWFQAGSGVVAKSDPDYELQEANSKLAALRRAIDEAAEY